MNVLLKDNIDKIEVGKFISLKDELNDFRVKILEIKDSIVYCEENRRLNLNACIDNYFPNFVLED